jgi:hypothetical protein
MHKIRLLIALCLVAGACGGDSGPVASEPAPDSSAPLATSPPQTVSPSTVPREAPTTSPSVATAAAAAPSAPSVAEAPAPTWPPARIHPTLVGDPLEGQMLMVGGLSRMQREMDRRDAWLLDPVEFEWRHLADGAPRTAFDFGLDAESAQLVAFNLYPAETWVFDLSAGTWERQFPDEQPQTTADDPRFGASLTYDTESDRLILFAGGSPWHMYADTWAYDADTATWELMAPSTSPSPRAMYATAYDAESDRVLLWGGFTGTSENDVQMWAYDYNSDSWEALPNSEGPQQHAERHGMAYLPELDRTLVYSGMLEEEGVLPAETWYYDYNTNTWTRVEVETSPPALAMYGMAYDETTHKVILYGGEMTSKYAGDLSPDIWVFDPASEDWGRIEAPAP